MDDQYVIVDDVLIGDEGFSVFIYARYCGGQNSGLKGKVKFTDGSEVEVAGKSFTNLRDGYHLQFDRQTKKVVKFSGMMDFSELGRLMDRQVTPFCLPCTRFTPEMGGGGGGLVCGFSLVFSIISFSRH